MALLWAESFDAHATAYLLGLKYDSVTGSSIATGVGRNGNLSLRAGTTSGYTLTKQVAGSAQANIIYGASWFKLNSGATTAATQGVTISLNGSGDQLTLQSVAVGDHEWRLELRRGGPAGTIIETQTGAQLQGKWYRIEINATIHQSTGAYEVRVNDTVVMSDTGVNTAGAAANDADEVTINLGNIFLTDGVYICDGTGSANNDFLGDVHIEGLLPDGDGNSSDWNPSSGSDHYALVDDPEASTTGLGTDRVTIASTGIDLYTYEDMEYVIGTPTILGVILGSTTKMEASGTQSPNHIVRSGGSNDSQSTFAVSGFTEQYNYDVMEENPVAAAAWSLATINAVEFGIELA